MRFNLKKFIIFLFIFTFFYYFSQETNIKKNSTKNSPLYTPSDASAVGLGGAAVATSPDDYSIFHNAGKYIFLKDHLALKAGLINYSNGISLSNGYFQSSDQNYTSLSAGGLITKFMALQGGFQMATRGIHLTNFGEKNLGDFSLMLGPSFKLLQNQKHQLGTGLNFRYYADLSQRKYMQTFAMDFGLWYNLVLHKDRTQNNNLAAYEMNFGLSLQNLFGKLFANQYDIFSPFTPAEMRLGWSQYVYFKNRHFIAFHYEANKPLIGYNTDYKTDAFSALIKDSFAGDLKEFFGRIEHSLAGEFSYNNMFTLRTGALLVSSAYSVKSSANMGFTFRYKIVDLGFAYALFFDRKSFDKNAFFVSSSWNFKRKS